MIHRKVSVMSINDQSDVSLNVKLNIIQMITLKCGPVFGYLLSDNPLNSQLTECPVLDIPIDDDNNANSNFDYFSQNIPIKTFKENILYCTHPSCLSLSQVLYLMN